MALNMHPLGMDQDVKTILKRWRGDMKVERVALAADVTVGTIFRWEDGSRSGPNVKHLRAMERLKPGLFDALKPRGKRV